MARILGVLSCALLLSLLLPKSGFAQQIPNQLPAGAGSGRSNSQSTAVPAIEPQHDDSSRRAAAGRERSSGPDAEIASQPGTIESSRTIGPQQGDEHALEISRQPGGETPASDENVTPREFQPSGDAALLEHSVKAEPEQLAAPQAPFLGITIAENSECLLGHEEHTLEVLSVCPGSPADKAGLGSAGGLTAPRSLAAAIFMPIGLAAHALLDRAGMPGHSGDLIIGVNDRRVRDKAELDRELRKLKPGDSVYLNIVRPLLSGSHQTLRVLIAVGEWSTRSPLKSARRSIGSASFDSHGNVSYTY